MSEESPSELDHEKTRTGAIHAVLSFVLALVLVVVGFAAIIVFVLTRSAPEMKQEPELIPTVRVRPIVEGSHDVEISTQGVVRSLREVALAAEVGGRVKSIAPELIAGAAVAKGQVLVEIEDADYKAALARAESGLADAELALEIERAQGEQAELDWKKLGRGEPGRLVMRKPQIAAAEARIESARSEVERAKRDLARATILAPFDAKVRQAGVEEGAVVAPGTPVAELYSVREIEVRLPFSLRDYGYLDPDVSTKFMVTATIGGESKQWPAELDRLEGEVERSTLSGYGIARISANADEELPPVGLFVEAVVPGKTLDDVVELPRAAVRGRNEVWVVNEGVLAKRQVEILRSDPAHLVVKGDFENGDQLVLTRLAAPMVGGKVKEESESAEEG